jgi:hypothetical protein
MEKKMNLAVGLNFDLLKTNLAAMFENDESGSKILLLPTKVDSPSTVSLNEMVDEFKEAFSLGNDADKIRGSLESVTKEGGDGGDKKKFDPLAITVQLQSAFIYKTIPAKGDGELEYAIAVAVNMADALPSLGFLKVNSLFLAVWNTERESVLRQIGTGNISNMLKELSA